MTEKKEKTALEKIQEKLKTSKIKEENFHSTGALFGYNKWS